jgi:glutamyl-tRNA synthetase
VNKNSAQFDARKLEAINGDKIRALEPADFAARITPFLTGSGLVPDPVPAADAELIAAGAALIQTRISKLSDAVRMLGFLFVDGAGFHVNPEDAARVLTPEAVPALAAAQNALAGLGTWSAAEIERVLRGALITGLGLKRRVAFTPVYVAVTGHRVAPPLFDSIELLGREKTLDRLAQAVKLAESAA